MQTTDTPGRTVQRKDAHSNRRRILATARRKLREDPDASLDSISQAAGAARRTLYGHFPSRHALIADLTQEAGRELRQAFAGTRTADADPVEAMTRMVLAAWTVGDHYRMLIALGRRHLGEDAIRTTLGTGPRRSRRNPTTWSARRRLRGPPCSTCPRPSAGGTHAGPRRGERRMPVGGPYG
ncbi:hypothetical protein SY2F82_18730 [Streptomyces sp. Y2F8-2]|nr:hypothetical protein SY2F82_18730 [Streptomyces sp. Y2F8-2]